MRCIAYTNSTFGPRPRLLRIAPQAKHQVIGTTVFAPFKRAHTRNLNKLINYLIIVEIHDVVMCSEN